MKSRHLILLCLAMLLCGAAGALVFAGAGRWDIGVLIMAVILAGAGMALCLLVTDCANDEIRKEISRTAEMARQRNLARAEAASLDLQLKRARRALRHQHMT